MRSLRGRLLVGVVGALTILVVGFGAIVYLSVSRSLTDSFDASLTARARALSSLLRWDDDEPQLNFEEQKMPEFSRLKRPHYFQFWEDGHDRERSPSLGPGRLGPTPGPTGPELEIRSVDLPDGRPGRALILRIRLRRDRHDDERRGDDPDEDFADEDMPDEPVRLIVLVVASGTVELEEQLGRIAWLVPAVGLGAVLLAWLLGFIVVGRGLSPLGQMADEIADLDEGDLAARLAIARMPIEVQRVGVRLNDLLAKLEAAFQRERSFTADVAHELRTPLAGMRATLEVALTRERDGSEYREALDDTLLLTKRQQSMVEQLLMLARLDAGGITPGVVGVDLGQLVAQCWKPLAPRAEERELSMETQLDGGWRCESDPEYLSMILTNVLDNAISYADRMGRITIGGERMVDRLKLVISNTGCTLTSADLSHVFERFWRKDAARSAAGVHCGIGLALTQRVAEVLGCEVGVGLGPQHTFIFSLSVPLVRQ